MAVKNPDEEKVTEAEAGVQAEPASSELRAGLATGSQAANPDQPDGHVIQTSVEGLSPDKDSHPDLSVVVKEDGKKGPAA